MAKHTYYLQALVSDRWVRVRGEVPKTYGEGFLAHHREAPGPRCGMRLVRSDGRVVDEVPANEEASIGMVAGWPTAMQYLRAARRCVALAAKARVRGAPVRAGFTEALLHLIDVEIDHISVATSAHTR